MKPPDVPTNMIVVEIPKAILLLTAQEYLAGLRRGKWWRRRQAMLAREADGSQGAPDFAHTSTLGPVDGTIPSDPLGS